MASPSKEDRVTELFLDNPTKHWHFEEIMRISGVSRGKTGKWLSRLTKEGIITRTKKQGEMPYYTGNHETPRYRNKKKLYAQTKLYESGLLDHLAGLKKPRQS